MQLVKLELIKKYSHVRLMDEFEMIFTPLEKSSYLVDKLINKYSGIDNLEDSISDLWKIHESLVSGNISNLENISVIDLSEQTLFVSVEK